MEQTFTTNNNVTFQENRDLISVDARKNLSLDTTLAEMSTVSEDKWNVNELMSRWFTFGTFTWSPTQTAETVVFSGYLPYSIASSCYQAILFSILTFFRYNLVFRIMISGTRFHQGMLRAAFHPAISLVDPGIHNKTLYSQLPNVTIKPDVSEPVELVIPYSQIEQLYSRFKPYNFPSPFQLGIFDIIVFNQLSAVTGMTTSVQGTVYVSFQNAKGYIPCSSSLAPHAEEQGGISEVVEAISSAEKTIQSAELYDIVGTASNGLNTIEKAVTGYKNIIDGNLDSQNVHQVSTRFVRDIMGGPSIGNGMSSVIPLNISSVYSHIVPPSILGSDKSETSIKQLCMRPGFIDFFDFNTQTSGTLLYSLAITPSSGYNHQNTSNIFYTWLGFMAQSFGVWKGSIRIHLEAIATQFHVTKLIVAFTPGHNAVIPDSLANAILSPHVVWDIREKHDLVVECPYSVPLPFLHCSNTFNYVNSTNSTFQNTYSGYLSVWALNELSCPSNVASHVEFNVYQFASPDFDFRKVRSPDITPAYYNYQPSSFVSAIEQGREDGSNVDMGAMGQECVVLGNSSYSADSLGALTGNETDDMIEVLRRHIFTSDFTQAVDTTNTTLAYFMPVTPTFDNYTAVPSTPTHVLAGSLAAVANSYVFWSGSLNLKIIAYANDGTQVELRAWHLHDQYYQYTYGSITSNNYGASSLQLSGYPFMQTSISVNPCLEISIPWSQHNAIAYTDWSQSELKAYPNPNTNSNLMSYFQNGTLLIQACGIASTATSIYIKIMMSAGPDFMLYYPTSPLQCNYPSAFKHNLLARQVSLLQRKLVESVAISESSSNDLLSEVDNLKNDNKKDELATLVTSNSRE